MKIFVVGRNSRIGRSLELLWRDFELEGTDSEDGDIRNVDLISRRIVRARPDVVVHCGAALNAEWCRENTAEAFYINSLGCANTAMGALRAGARMVLFSTGEVFGGRCERPWNDQDTPQPQSVAGRSIYCGEKAVRTILPDRHIIVRGSWLYGFADAADEDALPPPPVSPIQAPVDWYGVPTPFGLFAGAVRGLIGNERAEGVFHIGCEGLCSRADFWREYFRVAGVEARVDGCASGEIHSGDVPGNLGGLENSMLESYGIPPLPGWKKALADWYAMEKSQ